jgi:ligand-binding sensor domain-containing protein
LSRYSGEQATVFTKKDGLPDDYIVAFLQASDGKIWVGTRGGVAVIENGNIKAFTVEDGLASNYTRSLYEDSDGAVWIGSYDGGLTRFKDGKFTRFTMKDGLSSNGVFCILEDGRGWFWMNSNQGIFRVSRQELNDFAEGKTKFLTSISYDKQDGLLNIEGKSHGLTATEKDRVNADLLAFIKG